MALNKKEKNGLVWYEGTGFAEGYKEKVKYGFPTRLGGVSQGQFASLNLATGRGDEIASVKANYEKVVNTFSIKPSKYARNAQVHGNDMRVVTLESGLSLEEFVTPDFDVPSQDGLLTREKGIMLWVYSADCVPILFFDPVKEVIGAVHAGWRGTAKGIAFEMIKTMEKEFGSVAKDIQVVMGPSIKSCCFTCSEDVPEAVLESLGEDARPFLPKHKEEEGKFSVDLLGINRLWLTKAGVSQIESDVVCTACHLDEFWSHRKVGEARGVLGGFIYMTKEGEKEL